MYKKGLKLINQFARRDFQGYTGLAMKNSGYQFATTLVSKVGSIIFTIILARILMPELFGLYSLALATIIMVSSFFELGIPTVMIQKVSKSLSKKENSKAKAYFKYLLKVKIIFVFISIIFILLASSFLANDYYNKPIFLALLAGAFYILSTGFIGFFTSLLQSINNFKVIFYQEFLLQVLRIIATPLITLYALKNFLSGDLTLFFIIISLAVANLISLLFLLLISSKKIDFLKSKSEKLKEREKKETNRFLILISTTALSGMFFSYIDIFMLGHFVSGEFIGYYQAALSIIGSIFPLIPLAAVLFPIFSRIEGDQLERGFKKSLYITALISVALFILLFLLSPFLIKIIFGDEYLLAVPLLRILSLLMIITPSITIYYNYFIAIGKPGITTKSLIISTLLNIVLNYFLISYFLNYSQFYAVIGASIGTIISRYFYFFVLLISKRRLQ